MADLTKQQAAEQWAETRIELERANGEKRQAEIRCVNLRNHLETLSKVLVAGVGPGCPERCFSVNGEVVIVELNRGVRMLTPEPK